MGILSKLKSALGLADDGSDPQDRDGDGDVTVEHEPDAETEATVKGTNDDVEEPVAAETDASGSTASITEEPPETPSDEEVAAAAEPAEAGGPESQVEDSTPDDDGPESSVETPDVEDADEDVETVSGIGPAYAERLGEAGIETVGDLVAADAGTVAEESGISETRIERWQDRAHDT